MNVWPNRPQIRTMSHARWEAEPIQIPTTPIVTGSFNGSGFPFYGPHLMTGVDKLHNEGLIGTGVKVGIIDTGVDYTHPALGGCFGPGCKVAGGFDFSGEDPNAIVPGISNLCLRLTPDPDPLDCQGHGTHVAGILAADARHANASQPFVGVAPGATIMAYKTTVCNGSSADDAVVAAMARAHDDKVDIVSMSLGRVAGWPEAAVTTLANRLVQNGIFVSLSAGNTGDAGLFDAATPASGRNVLAVAEVDNIVIPEWSALTSDGKQVVRSSLKAVLICQGYINPDPFNVTGPFPLYVTAKSEADLVADACEPLADDTPDLSQFVVLVKRGSCTLGTKIKNVEAKNATMILYSFLRFYD